MNRPGNMQMYKEMDLKLGIKSSLPKAKSTLALLILMWLSSDRNADLKYSVQDSSKIRMSEICKENLKVFIQNVDNSINFDDVIEKVENNCLFQSQLESLIVAFELVWKLAKIRFADGAKANSAERTGNARFEKILTFTSNMDLIDIVVSSNDNYSKILLAWLLENETDSSLKIYEDKLVKALTCMSEDTICKLKDGEEDIIFNPLSVYDALDSWNAQVDISGDVEAKGALRVLKGALNEGLNAYLKYNGGKVSTDTEQTFMNMQEYAKRVKAYHSLQYIKLSPDGEEVKDERTKYSFKTEFIGDFVHNRIIFGAPGTGKSHRLEEDSRLFGNNMERVTFHPNYSYASFVGAYKPVMMQNEINCLIDDDKKKVIAVLQDKLMNAQEKYDLLYDKFKDKDLTRLPLLLGIYTDESFKTKKMDGTDAVGGNGVEKSHGKAIRPYLNLQPQNNNKEISYEYVPGPFMRTYVKALNNPEESFLLLIEEINRANVAAVFGDVFQLLDRKNGVSEYPIATSEDIKKYLLDNLECLKGKNIVRLSDEDKKKYLEMRIPENMYIWATMNSADQGVFPMDTAFKRRWEFEYISVNEPDQVTEIEKYVIPMCVNTGHGYYVNWNALRTRINNILIDNCKINEDKLLGPFFISKNMLDEIKVNKDEIDRALAIDKASRSGEDNIILTETHKKETSFMKAFESKVIMYLFEDVMKMRAEKIFVGHDQNKGKMVFSEICKAFENDGEHVFGITDIEHL